MKFIQVPAGFSLELFASEPDIVKPISFTFDERGRLWVIEAVDYPNDVRNGEPGDDRIKIRRGHQRRRQGRQVHRLRRSPQPRHQPDVRQRRRRSSPRRRTCCSSRTPTATARRTCAQILSTGWGIRDTHAGPSNLQYGPDNYIWGSVGYSGFDGEMNGKKLQFTQGVVPLQAGRQRLRVRDDVDQQHVGARLLARPSTCSGRPPTTIRASSSRSRTAIFEGVQGLPAGARQRPGLPERGAVLRGALHDAVHPPGRRVRRLHRRRRPLPLHGARRSRRNTGTASRSSASRPRTSSARASSSRRAPASSTRDGWNLLAGAEEWVAPVHAQVGPDGAVWVSDWYNFIAQHNPTPTGLQQRPRQRLRDSRCATTRAAASIASSTSDAPPAKKRSLLE